MSFTRESCRFHISVLLHIPSTGNIYCLVTRLEHSQQRPLERLSPQGVDDGVGAAVEDGDGVGKHAQQWVVGVQVDDLNLPPNHVGHVAHCQDEGHNGDGGPPPLIQFALKKMVGEDTFHLSQLLLCEISMAWKSDK